jgi:proteic killer suppression protein
LSIQGFAESETERFFRTGRTRAAWQAAKDAALRKLDQLNAAGILKDLAAPPGNRLEALKGDRKGQWSIRINDQWCIVFRWTEAGPADVGIVDYH